MRILLVVHGQPPASCGGTEIYVADLARRLAERGGDEVAVLVREADPQRPERAWREEEHDRVRLHFVNNTFGDCGSFEQGYRDSRFDMATARLVDRLRPDVVHVHHLTGHGLSLVDQVASRGIPLVMTLHDFWLLCQRGQLLDLELERCPGPSALGCARCLHQPLPTGPGRIAAALLRSRQYLPAWSRPLVRRLVGLPAVLARGSGLAAVVARRRAVTEALGRASLLLAPSSTLRSIFLANEPGLDGARLRPWKLGVETRRFTHPERTRGDRLRVGFLGSLMVSKAPHLLLEAAARLPAGAIGVHLYGSYTPYHGDDAYRARLEPLLSRPNVTLHAVVPHDEVPGILAALDVLVVPSVWLENSPLVIEEAFLAGVPVVASDLGGMRERVEHGRSGLLFRAGDVSALQRALARLVVEPGLLERLQAGLPPVRSMEDDARATRELYAELLAGRPAGA